MRIILPVLIVLTLIGCSKPVEKKGEVAQADTLQTPLKQTTQSAQGTTRPLDLDFIKTHTHQRLLTFSVPQTDSLLKPIPVSFLKEHIYPVKVSNLPQFSFPEDPYEQFYFHQYWENGQVFFFTFIHGDESCCRSVYCVSVDKNTDQIRDVFQLGLSGGDGGWAEEDSGQWVNDSILQVVKAEYYDDLEGKVDIDTTWLQIQYNHRGQFQQIKQDSVHYEEKSK